MAASAPVPSNRNDIATTTVGVNGTIAAAATSQRSDAPKQNLRGLNKPKCSKCGNVARSSFSFKIEPKRLDCDHKAKRKVSIPVMQKLLCKSSKSMSYTRCDFISYMGKHGYEPANHGGSVTFYPEWPETDFLKANATFPDKTPSSSSPMFNQQSAEVSSTSSGLGFRASLRASSIRQLSNNFGQFNGAQVPLRSRRPLTRKDAAVINHWRFSKLKEYKERNIEAENEAFDRYMQNVGLLDEVFPLSFSGEESTADMLHPFEHTLSSGEDSRERMISRLKIRLNSNQGRKDAFRQKIRELVDGGLKKLQKSECSYEEGQATADDMDDQKEHKRPKRSKDWQAERASKVNDIIDKLTKARNEEDLKSCLVMKSKLFNQFEKADLTPTKEFEIPKETNEEDTPAPKHVSDKSQPRLYKEVEINPETLSSVDMHFSSLDQIGSL